MRLPDPEELAPTFERAFPFPHLVLDGIFEPEQISAAAREFPPPEATCWHTFRGPLEEGKQEASADAAGFHVARIHRQLASRWFLDWLSRIARRHLLADPLRTGGGIHQSGPGARLGLHTDFNVHPERPGLVRAVNVLLFLSHVPPSRGGRLRLGIEGDRAVIPRAGRLVVFEASDDSWHGHPEPLAPDAPLRLSIPAYYYRRLEPGETVEAHSTRFWEARG
jgi:hypothetical protein